MIRNKGRIFLVSLGPGDQRYIVPQAHQAILQSEVVVGYGYYFKWIQDWLAGKEIIDLPLTQEKQRACVALEKAREGKVVSLVSSGDIGIYAMGALAHELMGDDEPFEWIAVPGVTAATSAASLLGAPLSLDFATLSLSDLLLPWHTIERKARHLARGDYVTALYNVQSASRQDGVYKILDIFLSARNKGTWCGVVENAYREEQKVDICTLEELRGQSFNMFTTLILGNSLTRRRGNRIFNPRGYCGFDEESSIIHSLPRNAFWVFSGTSDGNRLARLIQEQNVPVILSIASDMGEKVSHSDCPGIPTITGSLGMEARQKLMEQSQALGIVDATHPFATNISSQLKNISLSLNLPYIRYERPRSKNTCDAILCDSAAKAAEMAIRAGRRVFISTGIKEIAAFTRSEGSANIEWFLRMTPDPERLEQAIAEGISPKNICAMIGPFSKDFNMALWKTWNIDTVVLRDSGAEGGTDDKLLAARELGIRAILIDRPPMDSEGLSNFEDVLHVIKSWISD